MTSSGYYPSSLIANECLCSWSYSARVLPRNVGNGAIPDMKNDTMNIINMSHALFFRKLKQLWYGVSFIYVQPSGERWDVTYKIKLKRGNIGNKYFL